MSKIVPLFPDNLADTLKGFSDGIKDETYQSLSIVWETADEIGVTAFGVDNPHELVGILFDGIRAASIIEDE